MARRDLLTRMEEQMRGRTDRRPLRLVLLEAAIIVGLIFLLGYLLYSAQFSGGVRWALGFVVIAALAIYAWTSVARRTSDPRPLLRPPPAARLRTGELAALTATVRRASLGLTYSQVAVSSRAREAFAERTRLARGFSPEAMRRLLSDPRGLQRSFHDGLLEDFLFLASSDTAERYRWVLETRIRGGFALALNQVLDRMEAWR